MRALLGLLAACGAPDPDSLPPQPGGYDWGLPAGVEPPDVPADNPMSEAKVALGRSLFYDFSLSVDDKRACGLCHEQAKGFTDGFPRAIGALGDLHRHNTLPIVNVGYRTPLTWARPDLADLESQLLVPLFGDDPVEMGRTPAEIEAHLAGDPDYAAAFTEVFADDPEPIRIDNLARAIAAFERTVISVDSPWDRYERGESDALDPAALRGMELFFGERIGCARCHGGPDFDQPTDESGAVLGPPEYANLGLYDVDGLGAYPEGGEGLYRMTGIPSDMGRFRTPTLRNLAWTAPYLHDGTGATVADVVDAVAAGGRELTSGPNIGDGRANPHKDSRIAGFTLAGTERSDLLAFLDALGDAAFIADPRFADPTPAD